MASDPMNTGSKPKPAGPTVEEQLREAEKKFGPKPTGK